MTAEQFACWLQGFSELNDGEAPTPAQWLAIQDHLKLVFVKVTPFRPSSFDAAASYEQVLRGPVAMPSLTSVTRKIC